MPTKDIEAINRVLSVVHDSIEHGTAPPDVDRVYPFIPGILGIIHDACHTFTPVYWEGIARAHVLAGDYFRKSEWYRAYAAYDDALRTLDTFPFSADYLGDMEGFIRRALWERFVLARKLGNQKDARDAAFWGTHGIHHASGRIDPKSGTMYWDPVRPVRAGLWQQFRMRLFLFVSFAQNDKSATHV